MKPRAKKGQPLEPVDAPRLHCLYHVAWSTNHGVVGRCISIDYDNKTVVLRNPKTKKNWVSFVKWEDLRHTRKEQLKKQYDTDKTIYSYKEQSKRL